MLTGIKGYYDNGQVTLMEQPTVHTKTDVIVMFLNDEKKEKPKERVLGRL